MRRALYAVLLTSLFLLLMSALVVTPETAQVQPAADLSADFHAVFRPLVSAVLPDAADAPSSRASHSIALCTLPVLLLCTALVSCARDANGRVLSAVRYENSVYQLFRPEVAGG